MVQGVERSAASNESQGDPVVITTTVRSIPSSFREGGSIHLNTRYGSTSARQQQDSSSHNQKNAVHGFVDGNFSSGKILDLKLPSRCFVMSYDPSVTVLVVGTATSLEFFDAASQQQQYVVIHSVPCTSMISAVRWIPPPPSNADSHWSHGNANLLLATADLDGNISLYSINFEILEIQGPTLLYSGKNSSGAQIRSLDAGYCHYAGLALLLVAAGDKSGAITIASFQAYSQPPVFIDTIDLLPLQPHYPVGDEPSSKKHDSVLGLALQMELGIMATSTSGGLVQVHSLAHFIFSKSDHTHEAAAILWSRQHKGGAVRCVTVSPSDNLLAFGGYDKTVVLVDTQQWVVARELPLQGTVNTIEFDPQGRYLGVGCRDKTFTVFDTSTYVVVKVFHTLCWVTSCSWALDNIVAIRSETNCVSVLDLSPIRYTNISLSSSQQRGDESSCSLSWSRTGQFLARAVGSTVAVVDSTAFDADNNFRHVATFDMSRGNVVTKVAFCQAADKADLVAAVDDRGRLVVLRLRFGSDAASSNDAILEVEKECAVEPNLKALAWSPDGSLLATGGRAKLLHVFTTNDLKRRVEPIVFGGRIWDIDFVPKKLARSSPTVSSPLMAIALGDYTTTVLDDSYEPVLQISRTLTCRCLKFHPSARVMAIGDGAGTVAVVDYDAGELLTELHAGGRVNDLDYSPGGDFLIVGTDDCRFSMYESSRYLLLQETSSNGFALSASFAPSGRYLALGSESDNYKLIRLGPFLGVDLVPLTLEGGVSDLPAWALKESLFRSGEGPSFLQRHMLRGGSDNLRRVSAILRDHPHAIYTFDRQTGEGCFDTALRLKKPGLVKLVVLSLVDGTLDPTSDKETNFLTTNIPQRVRETLADIVENYPPDYIVDIFNGMTFMKVPFTGPRVVESGDRIECGSKRYTDPWSVPHEGGRQLERSATSTKLISRGGSVRTPAILPLPGLGDMDFLASLLASAPHDVFDSDALALVLRVLWENHIRRYYYVDCCLFAVFYMSWIVLVELVTVSASESPVELNNPSASTAMVLVVVSFNTLFAAKELVESRYGKRSMYWRSLWNTCDLVSIASVYAYSTEILVTGNSMVPLAVVTTLFLTVKVLSYLRGFSATGWLLSVLTANFRDVRGFLIILCTILVGFSVAFRLLFGETGDESFGSLRRSFLSTFELTITGSYDPSLLFEARYTVVAIITFILAITCVLVVALNALISILGDSYARVQQNAVANRRRELASLVVEYMSLLPPWKRRQIEKQTRWFHTLLEVDADGSLHVQTDDWEGGLNALRRDMEELSQANKQSYEKTLEHLKADLDSDIAKFKEEVVSLLENLADDVKLLRKAQSQSIIKFDPKQNMAKVVKAVRSVGRQGGGISKSDDN